MSSKRIIYSQQFSSDIFPNSDNYRFKFKKNSYAITTLIILLFRFQYLGGLIVFSLGKINFVHFFITSAFIFLPVLYMFLFIGHYSKLGCLVISRVIPVTYGVGHTMIVISVIQLVCDVAYASDALEFLYVSFESGLPWMRCVPEWKEGCIGLDNLNECARTNCFKDISQLSVYRYRVYAIRQLTMKGEEISSIPKDDRFWKNVEGSRLLYLLLCVMITMFISDLDISANNKMSNVIVTIYIVALTVFTLVLSLNVQYSSGVLDVFNIDSETLINSNSWVTTVLYFIENMSLSDVSTILIGSYLPTTAVTDLQAFITWLGLMILYSTCEIMSCIMSVGLANKLGTTVYKIREISIENANSITLVLYPQLLGSSNFAAPTLTGLYFALILLSNLIRIKLLLASIYNTVADSKPIIRAYKFYIRVFSCCFIFFLTFPIFIVGVFRPFLAVLRWLGQCLGVMVMVMITVGILYIYGVQTLCDDHHFTYGSQPAVFFKVTLFIAPAAFISVGALLFLMMSSMYVAEPAVTFYFYIVFPISIAPQVVGLLFITTYYLKRQNMAHLLKCEENWGDPNATTRKERIIYHPRKETNYFRRIDVCNHECLRYNRIFPHIVRDEDSYQKETYKSLKSTEKFYTEAEVGIERSDTAVIHF